MSILVTGGAGFIVIDNLSTGYLENLNNVFDDIRFIQADLSSYDLFSIGNIETVIHLSAQTSVPISIKDFKSSSQINLMSSLNVINFSSKTNVPLIYASSSSVYGNNPLGDDMSPNVDLISPYAVDKYSMELYAKMAKKTYGLSSVGLRFFNVYGPRQDPSSVYSGVISIFLDRLKADRKIQINGGHQTRDFVFVSDVVNVIEKSIRLTQLQTLSEKVNVLTGKTYTINELLEILSSILNKNPVVDKRDLPIGDPEKSDGTIDKMCRLFAIDSEKMINLHLGLKKTINF